MIPNPLLLNRSRAQIQGEQVYALYRRLYYYIVQDFRHSADCAACHIALETSLATFMETVGVHNHEALGQGPSAELVAIGSAAAVTQGGIAALVPAPIPMTYLTNPIGGGPLFVIPGGGVDEHSTAVALANKGMTGSVLNPSPAYFFSVRNPALVPDPAMGTAAAAIVAGGGAVTGEAGQPFSADTIAEVLKMIVP